MVTDLVLEVDHPFLHISALEDVYINSVLYECFLLTYLHYQEQQLPTGSAFCAFDNSGGIEYNSGEVFPFSVEHLDPGDNYNAETSTYTCPVTGIYMFR